MVLYSSGVLESNLLAEDCIMPEQFFDRNSFEVVSKSPEKKLMFALLEDAFECYQRYAFSRKPSERRLFTQAEQWIAKEGEDYIFSFDSVCENLHLDSNFLREGIYSWRKRMNPQRKSYSRLRHHFGKK